MLDAAACPGGDTVVIRRTPGGTTVTIIMRMPGAPEPDVSAPSAAPTGGAARAGRRRGGASQ